MGLDLLGMNGTGLGGMLASSAQRNAEGARPNATNAALAKLDPKMREKIEATATEFESVFLSQMLEYGFQGLSSNPLSEEGEGNKAGFADDTYRSMMLQEFGKKMAAAGGIGIADHVKQSMLAAQEMSHVRN